MDTSIYESAHPRNQLHEQAITYGRVTKVFVERRMVEVKTFLGKGELDDQHIPACQWISTDANPEGDEATAIPRINTVGIVFYIGGQPFFFGGIRGINAEGNALTGNEAENKLTQGDKIISTVGGNRIVVRANKVIEFISSASLRTTYSPKDERIRHLCQNYSLRTGGGRMDWEIGGAPLFPTVCATEYTRDLARTGVVYDQVGAPDGAGSTLMFRRDIGTAIPGTPGPAVSFWKEEIDLDGTWKVDLGPQGQFLNLLFNPDGSWSIKNLIAQINVDQLGNITFQNAAGAMTVTAGGSISVSNPTAAMALSETGAVAMSNQAGGVEMTPTGDVTLDGSGGKLRLKNGQAALGGPGGELFAELDKLLAELIKLGQALAIHTHTGNLGYTSSPALNSASFTAFTTTVQAIKTVITVIKGSL